MNPQHSICFLYSHTTIQNREVQSTWTWKGVSNYCYTLVSVCERETMREESLQRSTRLRMAKYGRLSKSGKEHYLKSSPSQLIPTAVRLCTFSITRPDRKAHV